MTNFLMRKRIDINCDVGERPETLRDGSEELLIRQISSANIACGVHAGDEETIRTTVRLCGKYGVAVGAHPSYPDRENFGRRELKITPAEIEACMFQQISVLARAAAAEGLRLSHIKPHGALYNTAARNQRIAQAIGTAVRRVDPALSVYCLAGSPMLDVCRHQGLTVVAEAFADRRYEEDGSLRSRAHPDALITSSAQAALQAVQIARDAAVISVTGARVVVHADTLCVHSDTPGSLGHLLAIREALEAAGIPVMGPGAPPRH